VTLIDLDLGILGENGVVSFPPLISGSCPLLFRSFSVTFAVRGRYASAASQCAARLSTTEVLCQSRKQAGGEPTKGPGWCGGETLRSDYAATLHPAMFTV
jgi:hypothetical protein